MRAGRKNALSVLAVTGVVAASMAGSPPAFADTGAAVGGARVAEAPARAKGGGDYSKGYREGYRRGYADGTDDGDDCNIDNRKKSSAARSAGDYDRGYAEAYDIAYPKGYDYAYREACK